MRTSRGLRFRCALCEADVNTHVFDAVWNGANRRHDIRTNQAAAECIARRRRFVFNKASPNPSKRAVPGSGMTATKIGVLGFTRRRVVPEYGPYGRRCGPLRRRSRSRSSGWCEGGPLWPSGGAPSGTTELWPAESRSTRRKPGGLYSSPSPAIRSPCAEIARGKRQHDEAGDSPDSSSRSPPLSVHSESRPRDVPIAVVPSAVKPHQSPGKGSARTGSSAEFCRGTKRADSRGARGRSRGPSQDRRKDGEATHRVAPSGRLDRMGTCNRLDAYLGFESPMLRSF